MIHGSQLVGVRKITDGNDMTHAAKKWFIHQGHFRLNTFYSNKDSESGYGADDVEPGEYNSQQVLLEKIGSDTK
ncbi:MAG: hypothetical protein ABIG89_06020 [Candidatus Woesearchaeota archaeon]